MEKNNKLKFTLLIYLIFCNELMGKPKTRLRSIIHHLKNKKVIIPLGTTLVIVGGIGFCYYIKKHKKTPTISPVIGPEKPKFNTYIKKPTPQLLDKSPWYKKKYTTIEDLIAEAKKNRDACSSLSDFLNLIKTKIIEDFDEKEFLKPRKYLQFYTNKESADILFFSNQLLNKILEEDLKKTKCTPILDKSKFNFKNPDALNPSGQLCINLLFQYDVKTNEIHVNKLTFQKIESKGDGHCMYHSMGINNGQLVDEINKKTDFSLKDLYLINTIFAESAPYDWTKHFNKELKDLKDQLYKINGIQRLDDDRFKKINDEIAQKVGNVTHKEYIKKMLEVFYLFSISQMETKAIIKEIIQLKDKSHFLYPVYEHIHKKHGNLIDDYDQLFKPTDFINVDLENRLQYSDIFPFIKNLFQQITPHLDRNLMDQWEKDIYDVLSTISHLVDTNSYIPKIQESLVNIFDPKAKILGVQSIFFCLANLYRKNTLEVKDLSILYDENKPHFFQFNNMEQPITWGKDQGNIIKFVDGSTICDIDKIKDFDCVIFTGHGHYERLELINSEDITKNIFK